MCAPAFYFQNTLMEQQQPHAQVRHDAATNRFVIQVGDHGGRIDYRMMDDKIAFLHTEVDPELEGQGVASQLAAAALDYARRENLRVLPYCPFVAAYIKRHPEYQELVAN